LALGTYAQRQGHQSQAVRLLTEGLSTAFEVGHVTRMPHLLSTLAAVASEVHQPERAARLLGAAERIMTTYQEIGPDFDDMAHRRVERRVRKELGEDAWRIVSARGQEMSPAELLTEARDLQARIPAAVHAHHGLSPRELDVLRKMAEGRSNDQIAEELFISRRTVASHVTGILNKLGVDSRTGAVAFAIRAGLA
jgi:DNA-binding CsgD family transcriptional regulator